MAETDEPEGRSIAPPTVPIKGSEPESEEPVDGTTGHDAFEKAKAESQQRK